MPLYPYHCTQCGYEYERVQKFSDAPETACPRCGGKVERPLTAPAFQFKGAGWYINDYAAKPASGGSSNAASASTPKTEAASTPPPSSTPASSSSE